MEGEEEYTPQEYRDYLDEEEEELPPLNEGDEAISLYDILVERDKSLTEEELWALCRECCLVLEVVNNSPEMFQTLCVTPDTVAFDGAGNVCFLDLDRGLCTSYQLINKMCVKCLVCFLLIMIETLSLLCMCIKLLCILFIYINIQLFVAPGGFY